MSEEKKRAQAAKATARKPTPYKDMTPSKKLKFVAKVAVCIITFGMIFPNVMSD